MKKVILFLLSITVMGIMVLTFSSCSEDEEVIDPPTVTIFASVDGYQVAFTATATNTDTYAWDFGDSEVSTEQNPVHTYAQSGTYTATLTVTGGGGTATESTEITIAASELEMLTGGPAMTSGKVWIFSPAASEGDGIFYADADFTEQEPVPDGILGLIGLASEYEDEFIFKHDLSYTHDVKNDSSVTNAIFAAFNQIPSRPSAEDVIVLSPFTPEAATFTYTEDTDLTLTVVPDQDFPEVTEDITWSDLTILEIAGGTEFIGIQDYTREYIVFDIGVDKLQLGMFISTTQGSNYNKPTHFIKMTFIPATE